jgi:spore germination protein KB
MMKQKIGQNEAVALITTSIVTKVFLAYPNYIVTAAGSAAWLIAPISGVFALVLVWFMVKLLESFPGKSFWQITEETVGSYLGLIVMLVLLIPWLFTMAMTLRRFSEMIITVALPDTPISIITLAFIGTSAFIAYLGIEAISRSCFLAFPFILGALILILILTGSSWETDWLFPLLGKGLGPIIKNSMLHTSDFLEINLLFVLSIIYFPRQIKKIGFKSILIAIVLFFISVLAYSLTFPSIVGEEPYLPLYMMARSVYLGRFIQRIEAIFLFFWVFAGYLWTATGIFGLCHITADTLKLPDYRPLILPTAIIITALSFIPANLPDTVIWVNNFYVRIISICLLTIPAMLLLAAKARGKGVKPGAKSKTS